MNKCSICGNNQHEGYPSCEDCELQFGEFLVKAHEDTFDYVIGLKNGVIIRFEVVESLYSTWVKLGGIKRFLSPSGVPWKFPRGIEVRLDDISWVSDCPEGT